MTKFYKAELESLARRSGEAMTPVWWADLPGLRPDPPGDSVVRFAQSFPRKVSGLFAHIRQ